MKKLLLLLFTEVQSSSHHTTGRECENGKHFLLDLKLGTICYTFVGVYVLELWCCIRLPISKNGGRKAAKIPNPWRLQIPLPKPCKYFLRMDVYKHTGPTEIM